MMKKLFSEDYGAYIPGFFIMELNLEINLKDGLNNLKDEERATLVHEYIHYLQDVSTFSGVNNFILVGGITQLYIYTISSAKEDEIRIPIDIAESGVENAYKSYESNSLWLGQSENKKIHHINKIIKEEEEILNDEFNISNESEEYEIMKCVNIYYDNKEIPYMFGRMCVAESMAYMIENIVYNITVRKNEFPYNSCSLVCASLYPQLAEYPISIIAICEIALMHVNSGGLFYEIILEMKQKDVLPKSSEEVYEFLKDRIGHLYNSYIKIFNEKDKTIDFLYPESIESTQLINKWLKEKLKIGYEERMKNHLFITKMIEVNTKKEIESNLSIAMQKFSLPLIKDKKNYVFSSLDNPELTNILVPLAITSMCEKSGENIECSMYEVCNAYNQKCLSEICKYKPWEQVKENSLCGLALYWYHFSLEGKSLIKK